MWNDHDHSNLIKEEDSGQWTTVGSSSQSASVGETITRNSWIVRTQERSQLNLVSVCHPQGLASLVLAVGRIEVLERYFLNQTNNGNNPRWIKLGRYGLGIISGLIKSTVLPGLPVAEMH